jgi:hypothetical protein
MQPTKPTSDERRELERLRRRVTELKACNRKLRAARRRYERAVSTAMDQLPNGVLIVDHSGKARTNAAARELVALRAPDAELRFESGLRMERASRRKRRRSRARCEARRRCPVSS